jgi:hypothetical protein
MALTAGAEKARRTAEATSLGTSPTNKGTAGRPEMGLPCSSSLCRRGCGMAKITEARLGMWLESISHPVGGAITPLIFNRAAS